MWQLYQGRSRRRRSSLSRSQVAPPSSERNNAPFSASTIPRTRSDLAGEVTAPIFPLMPVGRPGLLVSSTQVAPPSVDLYRLLSGPPLERLQGVRCTSQSAAYRIRGLLGSRDRSMAPAFALRNSTCSQVLPPSCERKTPRSWFGPKAWPSAAT